MQEGEEKLGFYENENGERCLGIKEFDMNTMHPIDSKATRGCKIMCIGKPGSGKSTIIKSILLHKEHVCPVGQFFSGTEDSNHFYSNNCTTLTTFNGWNEEVAKNFIRRQKIAKEFLPNPWSFCVWDDCCEDTKIFNKATTQSYFKNGLHWNMIFIVASQDPLDVKRNIRNLTEYLFIMKENNMANRERIYKQYTPGPSVISFQDFCEMLDIVTQDYTALVINNKSESNNIEDRFFYYKADINAIPKNWKFGHSSAWKCQEQRFDPKYVDTY